MIEEIIILISFLAMIIIFIAKIFSVLSVGKLYSKEIVVVSFSVAWICWLLFFISMSASFMSVETITTPANEVYTIANNAYVTYSLYLTLNNLLITIITFFTFLEIILLYKGYADAILRNPLGTGKPRER